MLASPPHNSNARLVHGFEIRQRTLASLAPLEREWAKKLIAEGTWVLIPDRQVAP